MLPNKKRILLISSFLLLPIMLVWFQITTTTRGSKWGYNIGLVGYWFYCLFTAWLMAGFDWNYLSNAWKNFNENRYASWVFITAFIPVVPTIFFFIPIIPKLTLATAALAIFTSVVNGPIEEFCLWVASLTFWVSFGRGLRVPQGISVPRHSPTSWSISLPYRDYSPGMV